MDCRVGSNAIQLLRVVRSKNALTKCVASKAFRDIMQFTILGEVLLNKGCWDLLWYFCKMLYTMYCLLRLADMKILGVDK